MTMGPRSHNTDAADSWPELPDILREAIRQAREAPAPADSRHRALERARAIPSRDPHRRPWPIRRVWLCSSGAVAATLLLGLGLYLGRYPPSGYQAGIADDPPHLAAIQGPYDTGATGARPRLILYHGRLDGADRDVLPVGLFDRDDWERVQGLRALSSSMAPVDRRGLEDYLRHRAGAPTRLLTRLVARDGTTLNPLGVYVQVVVEAPRARTLVDLVFRNPSVRPLSGTFEHTLPDGASPCCFTLFPGSSGRGASASPSTDQAAPPTLPDPDQYVHSVSRDCWGEPCTARVVGVESLARQVPRSGTPADCFRCPVGPVRPGGFMRVVLAYEEVLPLRDGKLVYRYRLPAHRVAEVSFTLQADASLARGASFSPDGGERTEVAGKEIRTHRWKNAAPDDEASFQAVPPDPIVQTISGRHDDGLHYLCARLRPTLRVRRVRFEGGPAARDVHVLRRNAEWLLAARFRRAGATRIVLEGERDGKKVTQVFPTLVQGSGQLAARAWAELAVADLLTHKGPDSQTQAVALGQRFGVASRFASFALEGDRDRLAGRREAPRRSSKP
jgi:hypothetical protein